jgi:hypothetical protein
MRQALAERAMKEIPATGIYYDDALIIVFQKITPDWQILAERLNPSSPYYDEFPDQDEDRANREAHRAYDIAQRLAHEWLQERRSRGILVALVRDPDTGEILQLDRHKDIFQYWPKSGGQPVYFNRKSFDNLVREITPPDGDSGPARPDNNAATGSKHIPELQQQILRTCHRLWPTGYEGRAKERDEAIRQEFKRLGIQPPSVRSIQRALRSD